MKILWFTNTPSGASQFIGNSTPYGGWLSSLENALSNDANINLYVSFYSDTSILPFKINNTNYYPVKRFFANNKAIRLVKRVLKIRYEKTEINHLFDLINNISPDLIHIHGTEENFIQLARLTKVPIIISIQGIMCVYKEKYYSGIPRIDLLKKDMLIRRIFQNSTSFFYREMANSAKRELRLVPDIKYILGRTIWDKRVSSVISPRAKYFLSNEMLRDPFYLSQWNKPAFNSTITIISVMSNAIYKGLETICSAAALMDNSSIKFKWKVIGLDKNDYYTRLVNKIYKNRISSNVEFLGKKTDQELVVELLNGDIFCQVSHIENSPNSLCEAMIVGIPIIATSVGGTTTLIKDHIDGLLIQDGDIYSLVGAIKETANDFERAVLMAKSARSEAQKRHDRANIVSSLISVYNEVIVDSAKENI